MDIVEKLYTRKDPKPYALKHGIDLIRDLYKFGFDKPLYELPYQTYKDEVQIEFMLDQQYTLDQLSPEELEILSNLKWRWHFNNNYLLDNKNKNGKL